MIASILHRFGPGPNAPAPIESITIRLAQSRLPLGASALESNKRINPAHKSKICSIHPELIKSITAYGLPTYETPFHK